MYRPNAYAVDDVQALHAAIRKRRFATLAAIVNDRVHFAYVPTVLDDAPAPLGSLRFHLARANPLATIDGLSVRLSFLGPDAYLSPDWYETPGLVPTWNYIAVEACGHARPLSREELRTLLADLSAQEEERLAPKKPWTPEKVTADRLDTLLNAIRGFEMVVESLEGKFKLSQEKGRADFEGAIAGLEARGDCASVAVASEMRHFGTPRSS